MKTPINPDPELDKQRKRVISQLIQADFTLDDGRADMPRIYEWVMKMTGKKFNRLDSAELTRLNWQAEQVKQHFLSKL